MFPRGGLTSPGGGLGFAAVETGRATYPSPLSPDRILLSMADSESPEEPDAEFHHLLAEFHAQEQARVDRAKHQLRDVIFPRLKKWGVAKVEAEYSGYGDSGSIDGISYLDAAGEPVNMNLVRPASDPDIENVLYEFLPAGFEINEGSQGTLTLDVQAGTVTVNHGENEVISHESRREFTVQ